MAISIKNEILSVDQVTLKIKEAVASRPDLQDISVRGELIGFKMHTSGHAYFTIQGKESRISCVLFRSYANSVIKWPKDGDEVLVRGRLDIYGARGSYQIYAVTLLPVGEGAKARAKELLMQQLTKEGLFDVRHKRPVPPIPEKVAVITSPTGAALHDVIKISSQRYPATSLLVIPSLMQGVTAAQEITAAFAKCASLTGLSAVLLVRGGGSRDDLDTFDNEMVVRAVRSCPVPVVTGLGHQIDRTLSDMAADLYAPTPSGAAERVFPDRRELLASINEYSKTTLAHLSLKIKRKIAKLYDINQQLAVTLLRGFLNPAMDRTESAGDTLFKNIDFRLTAAEAKLASVSGILQSSSPLAILAKGYAICKDKKGKILRDAAKMSEGDKISITMRDGGVQATVDVVSALPASGENL